MRIIVYLFTLFVMCGCVTQNLTTLTSPDGELAVDVYVTGSDTLAYSVARDGQAVILESDLGLQLAGADFTQDVEIENRSPIRRVSDTYEMKVGKKSRISYTANEQTFLVTNKQQQKLWLVFRVSDDGVAFRYIFDEPAVADKRFINETTSFSFAPASRAWLQPMAVAKSGWSRTNPSYEEHYQMDIPVGTESTLGAGWVFPALFKTGDTWVLISEAGLNRHWHGSRLDHDSTNGEYKIAVPDAREIFPGGALLANTEGKLVSPWRIIAIGELATIMESTLGTDLADPAIAMDTGFVKPGHSSWSWAILKDDFTTFDVQKKFIDYAADMHWDYTLIDADWDRKIGYEKLRELVDYAADKGVGILVWFNSSGSWNDTPYTPKGALLTHEQRERVFSRLQDMGVKGVKVDFFGGDGQSMMAYYLDILKDAADHNLLVNFHGATIPRGWQRTYPNLVSMESIRGFEFTTFGQENEDVVAPHTVTALFTRNVFDPMDFTPMVFGDIPNTKRTTENSFELADAVLMISGVQHFVAIPEGMATVPEYVREFLRELPREWDDVKFIDGYPGKYVVLARRAGDSWYVAGINGDSAARTIALDLGFTGDKKGMLIESGETARAFSQREVTSQSLKTITLRPGAGFVLVLQ